MHENYRSIQQKPRDKTKLAPWFLLVDRGKTDKIIVLTLEKRTKYAIFANLDM